MPSIPRLSPMRTLLAVLCAAISTLANPRTGGAQTLDESVHPDSMLVYAADLEVHPERYARVDQILVFGMQSDQNIGRFRLKQGLHRFCLEGGAGFFTGIVLETDRGAFWPTTPAGEACVQAELPAGIISVVLLDGEGVRPDPKVSATVRVDQPLRAAAPAIPLVDGKNSPVGGYWLIQDTDVNARGTYGLALNFNPVGTMEVLALRSSIDQSFFIRFPSSDGARTYAYPDSQELWDYYDPNLNPYQPVPPIHGTLLDASDPGIAIAYGPPPAIQLQDLGNYQFLGKVVRPEFTQFLYSHSDPTKDKWILSRTGSGDRFQVLFRYFPDGSAIGDLQPGEVAVYDQCNFKGRAAIFVPSLGPGQVSPPYQLASLTSTFFPLNGTLRSVRVSKHTGVYWGPDEAHLQGGAIQDTPCLDQAPEQLLYVEPIDTVIANALPVLPKSCENCDFSGPSGGVSKKIALDFRGWDLKGANFDGALLSLTYFTGATLSGATFRDATLLNTRFNDVQSPPGSIDLSGASIKGADFTGSNPASFNVSGATLCDVSLHGSDANDKLDLTSGGAMVTLGGECSPVGRVIDLSYSIFNLNLAHTAEMGPDWGTTNLTGATVLNVKGAVLSSQQSRLQLGGVSLSGASLNGALLDYAQGLAGKDLTGIHLNQASLQYVNLQAARLYSANLQSSNLNGANLNAAYLTHTPGLPTSAGAHLDGAYLFNVNLSQAQLSGASFAYASFYGVGDAASSGCGLSADFTQCATAVGATMDDANFSNAYLYGVDFSSSTAQGINFTGAYLAGANFTGATISTSTTGNPTAFDGASLEGATFLTATAPPSLSLAGSLFDFTPNGNVVTFLLDEHHTTFPGYWSTPGTPVCATMTYENASVRPPTRSATVCPDGGSYYNGCGPAKGAPWKSNADLPASYTFGYPSTYYQEAKTPACNADFQWNQGPGQTLRPARVAGETNDAHK